MYRNEYDISANNAFEIYNHDALVVLNFTGFVKNVLFSQLSYTPY